MCSQVNRPVPESSPLGHASGGFALVIALSLMAFVLLLLLSVTTFVQIESQSAATRVDRLKAQQAALLSLNIAIGKLQQTAGLDQRVTAPATAVATVNGPKQLTGVWRSWEGRDHKANGFPITPNYGSKLADADLEVDVSSSGTGRFIGWLVSSAYDTAIIAAADVSADSPPMITEVPATTVPLVGKGSVGTGATPSYADANEVHLEPTRVDDANLSMAWWVSGENTKSLLSVPATPINNVLGWTEHLASSTRPDESLFNISVPDDLDRVASRAGLDYLSSRGTLVDSVSQEFFHDLTYFSRGLLTNTATGGWRRDLSLFSEQFASLSDSSFSPLSGLPLFTLEPGIQTEARKGGDDVGTAGALVYPWSVQRTFPNHENNPMPGHSSTSWNALADYVSHYKKIVSGTADGIVQFESSVGSSRDEVPRSLVLARIHWVFSFDSKPELIQFSTRLIPLLKASPILTIWNPYSVALDGNGPIRFRDFNPLPYKLKFSVDGEPLSDEFLTLPEHFGDDRLFFVIQANDSQWKPGETRIYSMIRDSDNNRSVINVGYRPGVGYRWPLSTIGYDSEASFRVELEEYPEASFTLGLGEDRSLVVTHNTSIDPTVVDRYWPEDLSVTNTNQTLGSVQGSPEPFLTAIMQLRNLSDRSTDSAGYAQAKPVVSFTSNAAVDGAALTTPEVYPFDWVFFTPSNSLDTDSLPQSGAASNGFIGTSFRADVGLSRLVVAELPAKPLRSMGELQHFDVNYNNPRPPYTANPIGNSLASFLIAPDRVDLDGAVDDAAKFSLDHGYVANHLLWDDWFVSSITPETESFQHSEKRPIKEVYKDFISGGQHLPNSAYFPVKQLLPSEAETAANDLIADVTSWHRVAAKLEVDGMFNINSTSIPAWMALLKHANGDRVPYTSLDLSANSWSVALEDGAGNPVSRTSFAGDPEGQLDPFVSAIGTHKRLSDSQIDALATEIVEQIKQRGPFLSLSEFINRKLTSDGGELALAKHGAIEAALNVLSSRGSDENPYSELQTFFTEEVVIPAEATYAFPAAAEGNLVYGFPGWIRQADVLRPIAPILSARDDTFIIRAYGGSLDPLTGDTLSGAWCEAVLKRTPNYVDAIADAADVLPGDSTLSSETNKRFGRRFVIISFRWLSEDDV